METSVTAYSLKYSVLLSCTISILIGEIIYEDMFRYVTLLQVSCMHARFFYRVNMLQADRKSGKI